MENDFLIISLENRNSRFLGEDFSSLSRGFGRDMGARRAV
jgi:hypothetical protein